MEDGGSPYYGLIAFAVLLLLNGWYYAFEAAMDSVNESELEKKQESGKKNASRVLNFLDHTIAFEQTIRIMTVINGVLAGLFPMRQFTYYVMSNWFDIKQNKDLFFVGTILVVLLLGMLLFAIVSLASHKIGKKKALSVSMNLVLFIQFVTIIMLPVRCFANGIANLFVRLFGVDPHATNEDVTEEEIISMVNEGHEQGVLEASEAEMIHNIFEFGDKEAGDIMTHRKNMVVLSGYLTLKEALEIMLEGNNTRYPVFDEDMDNIIGIVHLRDIMAGCHEQHLSKSKLIEVPELLRDVEFIPETRNINLLFQSMQRNKSHMVIVVDEYGQTSGLVTMEDILEEIVGNIFDEYDEDHLMIVKNEDDSYFLDGAAPIEEVAKALNLSIDVDDFDTLNGYLVTLLDSIPESGKHYTVEDEQYRYQILAVDNKMIQSVEASPLEPKEQEQENNDLENKEEV